MVTNFRLPETTKEWPLPRRVNPYYDEVSKDSADWVRSFRAFSTAAQGAFDKCDFGLLAALSFPTQDREQYRSACDLMNLFFVIDEHTDVLDEASVQVLADISMDALLNPIKPRPDGESVIGEIMRQFWSRAIRHATPMCYARPGFESAWSCYTASVVEQARDREGERVRTVEEYMVVRRLTIGAEPCYALAELGFSLPQEVHYHPLLQELQAAVTVNILIYDNDLASYNKERASGDDLHNIITIAMHENSQYLEEAIEWIAARYREQVEHALATWPRALALSFSRQVDEDLIVYIDHLMNWPRANECWAVESGRYFGGDGLRVQKERVVELLPRSK
ncbi:terpenoid synthase [Ganoderma leucocontextum]|nr:terpenoid synthase [Ganoderma leucocontextum]